MFCPWYHASSHIMHLEPEIFLAWVRRDADRSRVVSSMRKTQTRWVGQWAWGKSKGSLEPTYLVHIATGPMMKCVHRNLPSTPPDIKSKLLCIIFMILPYSLALYLHISHCVTQLTCVRFPKPHCCTKFYLGSFTSVFFKIQRFISNILSVQESFTPSFPSSLSLLPSFHQQLSEQIFL